METIGNILWMYIVTPLMVGCGIGMGVSIMLMIDHYFTKRKNRKMFERSMDEVNEDIKKNQRRKQ